MTSSTERPQSLRQLLAVIREDYRRHGSTLQERAVWALVVFRYGQYVLTRRFKPWRWFLSKCYGLLRMGSQILTGITIESEMQVGAGLHFIHAEGPISIHPKAVIGDRCGIMHNVTIGTNMSEHAPVIGDDVFIGVGACILGRVKVGDRVHISANSVVMTDIPSDSTAIGIPAKPMPRLTSLSAKKPAKKSESD